MPARWSVVRDGRGAAVLLDRGQNAESEAAMAKAYGTRVANDLVRDAIQIHGAGGLRPTGRRHR
jgi:alkylation response protein AidB-like acyl-CoA dehydrogenase